MLIRALLESHGPGNTLASRKEEFETLARRKGHRVGRFYNEEAPELPNRSSLFQLLRDKGLAIASQGRFALKPRTRFREELFRLTSEARPGDVLLVARVGSLQQLNDRDWQHFRDSVRRRKIRVVSLDVESSWVMVSGESAMATFAEQLTALLLDMLEIQDGARDIAHRRRHLEGIAKAKTRGKYKGRPADLKKHERILALLEQGCSWSEVCRETGASRSTVARVVKAGGRQV